MFRKLFVLTSLILMFGVVSSVSADIHWDGSEDSEWTNASNWVGDVVPGINDKSSIGYQGLPLSASYPVISSAVPDVGFLSIAGGDLTIADGGSIHANNAGAYVGEGNMGNNPGKGIANLVMTGNSTLTIDSQFAVARYHAIIKLQGAGATMNAWKFKLGTTGRRNGVTGTDGVWRRVNDLTRTGPGELFIRGGTANVQGGEFFMYEWDVEAKEYYANGGPEDGLFTGQTPYVVKGACDDREGTCVETDDYAGGENYTDLLPDGVYPGFLGADHYSNLIDIGDGLMTISTGAHDKAEIDATVDRCITEGTIRAWGNISGAVTGYSVVKTWGPGDAYLILTAIPEPATIALLGLGGLALLRRKR